ncbi:MAG: hypothetical protein JXK05_09610 [Campylobacterales bacterium]|nr:hypothetical protein [Campylobacterales bacterium]
MQLHKEYAVTYAALVLRAYYAYYYFFVEEHVCGNRTIKMPYPNHDDVLADASLYIANYPDDYIDRMPYLACGYVYRDHPVCKMLGSQDQVCQELMRYARRDQDVIDQMIARDSRVTIFDRDKVRKILSAQPVFFDGLQ